MLVLGLGAGSFALLVALLLWALLCVVGRRTGRLGVLCAAGGALFFSLALALGLAPRQSASGGAAATVGSIAAEAAARAAPVYSSRGVGLLLMGLCMGGAALAALAALAVTSLVAPRRAQAVDVW